MAGNEALDDAAALASRLSDRPMCVADRYEVHELLGRGGMAQVFRARDTLTNTTLALKLLTADGSETELGRNVELFEREFHTLVQLAHPRVVRAYDYGVDGRQP